LKFSRLRDDIALKVSVLPSKVRQSPRNGTWTLRIQNVCSFVDETITHTRA